MLIPKCTVVSDKCHISRIYKSKVTRFRHPIWKVRKIIVGVWSFVFRHRFDVRSLQQRVWFRRLYSFAFFQSGESILFLDSDRLGVILRHWVDVSDKLVPRNSRYVDQSKIIMKLKQYIKCCYSVLNVQQLVSQRAEQQSLKHAEQILRCGTNVPVAESFPTYANKIKNSSFSK